MKQLNKKYKNIYINKVKNIEKYKKSFSTQKEYRQFYHYHYQRIQRFKKSTVYKRKKQVEMFKKRIHKKNIAISKILTQKNINYQAIEKYLNYYNEKIQGLQNLLDAKRLTFANFQKIMQYKPLLSQYKPRDIRFVAYHVKDYAKLGAILKLNETGEINISPKLRNILDIVIEQSDNHNEKKSGSEEAKNSQSFWKAYHHRGIISKKDIDDEITNLMLKFKE